jgi:cytochrome P450 family 1 subfamily B polypeptide 1/cytochrome P450 family 1 subfamily C
MWLTVLLVTTVFILYQYFLKKNRLDIPGPFRWPLVGTAISLDDDAHLWFHAMAKKYGDIFLMKIGCSCDIVVLNSIDVINEALVQQRAIFSGRPIWKSFGFISEGMGVVFNSPATLGAKKWKTMKSILVRQTNRFLTQRAQTDSDLNHHVVREAGEMIRLLRQHNHENDSISSNDKKEYNPTENIINLAAANVACMTVFGHRYNHENDVSTIGFLHKVFGK